MFFQLIQFYQLFEDIIRLATAALTMSEILNLNALEKEAREEFEAERSQGAGGAGGLMEVDGMEDDYDYYESQAARQDRMKS
ncbi:MAG: hypothetical protein EZS28_050678 [Streblomastix strix]|uniref:Uncharacterized protein n=1 Tax=Streblomastix strix TaxID=222440 RepID=A0A5J4T5U8_9EUKA|nr:MAG: hypothetical protein EZS28_050678 [Streblomastix strix]